MNIKTIRTYELAWISLLLITVMAYWHFETTSITSSSIALAVLAVVAGAKVSLVAYYFMELNHSPTLAKVGVLSWIAALALLIAGMPYIAPILFEPYL
jgi:heme/copper-type cytochrome/quinol oxidase subunit 4